MSGRHSWSELTKNFSAEMRNRVDEAKREIRAEMALGEFRRARVQDDVVIRIDGDEDDSSPSRG